MKRVILVLALIVVGVACLGFYLDWFHLGSESVDGKTHVTFTVDKDKIKEDEAKALEKVGAGGHEGKDKAASTATEHRDD